MCENLHPQILGDALPGNLQHHRLDVLDEQLHHQDREVAASDQPHPADSLLVIAFFIDGFEANLSRQFGEKCTGFTTGLFATDRPRKGSIDGFLDQ